ncbi:TadE/TadG family type IV pilus assembly protein [Qipengyuania sphaerica]|uniref:TadE/TadG family type IV pilus assembly protein n=1 Tax=Qipengyuania sphaerica TaxID=2867243 RepID=UPI001C86C764|nr:TadE/TadG family type IV pilus assembly protein [Qipengyuania sphaerica]MBX7540637.1 pilus assembly protein [Qipengyuania sphaerica]
MMRKKIIQRLRTDERGSTIIEFALLAPVILGMFLGLMQIGISMQAYNSLRGVASDTARYAVVQYMIENEVTDTALEDQAVAIAKASPYLLGDSVAVTVTPVASPRVHGTHEKTLTITYTPLQILPFFDFTSGQMTFSRPIFVIDE